MGKKKLLHTIRHKKTEAESFLTDQIRQFHNRNRNSPQEPEIDNTYHVSCYHFGLPETLSCGGGPARPNQIQTNLIFDIMEISEIS